MSLPANYPGSLDSLANPGPTTETDDAGFELDLVIGRIHALIQQLEAKVGIGASTPSAAGVLRRTSGSSTAWGVIATADLAAGAITQFNYGNMTPGSVTTSPTLVAVPMSPLCTLTTQAGSQVLLVSYFSVFSNTAAAGIAVSISVDGVAVTSEMVANAPGVNINVPLSPSVVNLPAAGAHTYGMLWRTTAGQITAGNGQLYAFEIKR